MSLMMMSPYRRIVDGLGPYEYLRTPFTLPQSSDYGPGITFNSVTGKYEGTAVDHTEPEWDVTVPLTDLGDETDNGNAFQAAVNLAYSTNLYNTLITAPAGWVGKGSFAIPANTLGYWVGFKYVGSLPTPSPGTSRGSYLNRASVSSRGTFPQLIPNSADSAVLRCSDYTAKFYARGIDFANPDDLHQYFFLAITASDVNESDPAKLPQSIIFAQCLVDGGDISEGGNIRRAFLVSCYGFAFVDSHLDRCGIIGDESQGILVGGGGSIKANNNFMKVLGTCQNIMSGGVGLPGDDAAILPTGMEFAGNAFDTYVGSPAKSNIEIKYGAEILMDGNLCLQYGSGSPQQARFVVKLTDQGGGNIYTDTRDVTLVNNKISTGPGGFSINGSREGYDGIYTPRRIYLGNNLVYGLDVDDGYPTRFDGANINYLVTRFNTFVTKQPEFGGYYGKVLSLSVDPLPRSLPPMENCDFRFNTMVGIQNINEGNLIVASEDGGGAGQDAWTGATTGVSPFEDNLLYALDGTKYSNQLRQTTIAALGCVDPNADQYQLDPTSPGYKAGPDGQDIGYVKSILDEMIALVMP